jgi:hypothetical protein
MSVRPADASKKGTALPWYRCLARGENFPKANPETGAPERYGFYTTRFVVANSPKEAEMKALALRRRDRSFEPPAGCEKPKDARVFFEEIEQIRRLFPRLSRRKGATWHSMEDEQEG